LHYAEIPEKTSDFKTFRNFWNISYWLLSAVNYPHPVYISKFIVSVPWALSLATECSLLMQQQQAGRQALGLETGTVPLNHLFYCSRNPDWNRTRVNASEREAIQ